MIISGSNSLIEPKIGDSGELEKNNSSPAPVEQDEARAGNNPRRNDQPRREKRDVHGWVVLDKPHARSACLGGTADCAR